VPTLFQLNLTELDDRIVPTTTTPSRSRPTIPVLVTPLPGVQISPPAPRPDPIGSDPTNPLPGFDLDAIWDHYHDLLDQMEALGEVMNRQYAEYLSAKGHMNELLEQLQSVLDGKTSMTAQQIQEFISRVVDSIAMTNQSLQSFIHLSAKYSNMQKEAELIREYIERLTMYGVISLVVLDQIIPFDDGMYPIGKKIPWREAFPGWKEPVAPVVGPWY
jgi:hypothetical protein